MHKKLEMAAWIAQWEPGGKSMYFFERNRKKKKKTNYYSISTKIVCEGNIETQYNRKQRDHR